MFKHSLHLALATILVVLPAVADAQLRTDKRLQEKVSIDVKDKPMDEFLRELGEKYKIPVELDPSIPDFAPGPITLRADGITLGSVIHLACESQFLVATMEKGRLAVMSKETDMVKMIVRDYPLAQLGAGIDPQLLSAGLTEMTSGPWKDVDGEGGEIAAFNPQTFRILQSLAVHAELQNVFDQITAATGRPRPPTVQERSEQALLKKLNTPSQFSAEETPLPELFEQLLRKNGISYWIDATGISDEGIDLAKLNSKFAASKKLSTAARLDAIAMEHQLSWTVADELVQITSVAKADDTMINRLYDVRRANVPAAALAEQMVRNKELGKWMIVDEEGGSILPLGTGLLIRQNAKAHAKIAKLLN
ncbi:MAG: hypothetical protein WCJ09_26760 [Planctomycetota bacterium]